MIRRNGALRIVLASSVLVAAACRDAPELTAPGSQPEPVALQQVGQVPAPDPTTLSRAIPGFGGFFLGEGGVPTVYLTDLSRRDAAERALGAYVRGRGLATAQLRVVPGQFGYAQLAAWFDRVSPEALAVPGAVFVDLDEASNLVRIGVENAAASAGVRGVLARLGVPSSAVIVELTEPIGYAATLQDFVRPVQAGLQINFGQFVCSIGFNAVSGSQNSFVTASHCTNRQGGTEGTLYYQPLASTANSFIGTEVADPVYFRGGVCPRGKKCRFSDSARAAYAAGVSFDLGGIASTSGPNNGSITITGTINITAENGGGGLVGSVANKIGRTTGWTQGQITNTCVNTAVSGSNIVQLCQTFVSAGVGGGDSGSDVFALSGVDATLLGILWGGNSSGTLFVFSPLGQVEQELGALTTF